MNSVYIYIWITEDDGLVDGRLFGANVAMPDGGSIACRCVYTWASKGRWCILKGFHRTGRMNYYHSRSAGMMTWWTRWRTRGR